MKNDIHYFFIKNDILFQVYTYKIARKMDIHGVLYIPCSLFVNKPEPSLILKEIPKNFNIKAPQYIRENQLFISMNGGEILPFAKVQTELFGDTLLYLGLDLDHIYDVISQNDIDILLEEMCRKINFSSSFRKQLEVNEKNLLLKIIRMK